MFKTCKRVLAMLSIVPIAYAIGYYNGRRKGDAMFELAEEVTRRNAEQVEALNVKVIEVNRAMAQIEQWEAENLEDFYED